RRGSRKSEEPKGQGQRHDWRRQGRRRSATQGQGAAGRRQGRGEARRQQQEVTRRRRQDGSETQPPGRFSTASPAAALLSTLLPYPTRRPGRPSDRRRVVR